MSSHHKTRKDHAIIDISGRKCVFRVPIVLHRQNPKAYTPDVVSIGPFHHYRENPDKEEGNGGNEGKGQEDFQLMKLVKKRYLDEVLAHMNNITLEELTVKITELSDQKNGGACSFEERARNFYGEPLVEKICSRDFIEMMIVDGCFLVQLFRKCKHSFLRASDDPLFNMGCMFHFLCHDILLLENQLPWFVIHCLYTLTLDIYPDEASLSTLILKAFSILPSLKQSCSSYNKHLRIHRHKCHCDADYLHILDLLRASIVIPLMTIKERALKAAANEGSRSACEALTGQLHSATALSDAGITFQPVIRESMLDIRFKEGGGVARNGVLLIPQVSIGMSSETLFRNLIAIEHCYHGYSNEFTSYVVFMANLISRKEDMELLWKEKVISDWLSVEDDSKFFRNLYKDIPHIKFYYADLCRRVNQRYKLRRYRVGRKCNLYFPKLVYVFVGVILLQVIPTILQTIYAIKQYYDPRN